MCDLYDVLLATTGSAVEMVTSVYLYGGNNMGEGLRRLASDMLTVGTQMGYEQAAAELVPIAFEEGQLAGWCLGVEEGQMIGWCQGFETGHLKGMIKGSLITIATAGVVGLTGWGIKKLVDHKKRKQEACLAANEVPIEEQQEDKLLQEQ